jgi:hypothetical protein
MTKLCNTNKYFKNKIFGLWLCNNLFTWLMKMIPIPGVNIVYSWICLNSFLLFTVKFIKESIYSHGRGKISHFINRLLHEFLGLAPAIILTVLFYKVNILLLDELAQKIKMRSFWDIALCSLDGAICQKAVIFILATVITWNLTYPKKWLNISLWNENRQNKLIWECQVLLI